MKNLIVYFSHNNENYVNGKMIKLKIGNTKIVAHKIHEVVKGDIVEIQPKIAYPYNYKDCANIAKKELDEHIRPKILNPGIDMNLYDTIYLGYPNWWGTMPMCVCSFLESHELNNKRIYPFCTHEGSYMGSSECDIKRICPTSKVSKGLAIKGSQVSNSDELIRKWIGGN